MNTLPLSSPAGSTEGPGACTTTFHEILFAMNLAFAGCLALLFRIFSYRHEGHAAVPVSALKYFVMRGAVRISDFLHLSAESKVGREATFAISVLGFALALFGLLRIIS